MLQGVENLSDFRNYIYPDNTVQYNVKTTQQFHPASTRYNVIKLNSDEFLYRWLTYVETQPNAHIFNHPMWFKALEHEYNRKGCVLASFDNDYYIKGILPLLPTLGLPLKRGELVTTKRYSSLPRTPLGGFLADDDEAARSLLEEATNRIDSCEKTFLQLKSYTSNLNKNNRDIQMIPWRYSYYFDLPDDISKIRFGNKKQHHRVKWAVNKAKKSGIKIREAEDIEDLRNWYQLYLQTMRWHFVAVRPFRFFRYLWENFCKKDLLTVLLAETENASGSQLLAGSFFLHFNKTFLYSFNGRSRKGLESHANDLIQWEAIHLAVRKGYSVYDMGEVSCHTDSLVQFKSKWGCCKKRVYHYYYPLNEEVDNNRIDITTDVGFQKTIWRKIPLPITKQWGIVTNRFL